MMRRAQAWEQFPQWSTSKQRRCDISCPLLKAPAASTRMAGRDVVNAVSFACASGASAQGNDPPLTQLVLRDFIEREVDQAFRNIL